MRASGAYLWNGGKMRQMLLAAGLATAIWPLVAAPSRAAPVEATAIRVLRAPTAFEPLYIAQDQGFFAKHGLKVEIAMATTADSVVPQLINGQAQFAETTGLAVINAVVHDIPVTLVLSELNTGQKPPTAALIALKDSPVHSVKDLVGKKVGVNSLRNQAHLGVLLSARAAGVDPKSITFVEIPPPALDPTARKGAVAAIYSIEPFMSTSLGSGFRIVEDSMGANLKGSPGIAWAAAASYVEKNPDVTKRFNAAMQEAYVYANAHPEAVRAVDIKNTRLSKAFIESRDVPKFYPAIYVNDLLKMGQAMKEFGWITKVPPATALVASEAPTK